jgi:hypothetical protein
LGQHARAYGGPAGDGTALIELMIQEAGLPQSTLDAVAHLGGVTKSRDVSSSWAAQEAARRIASPRAPAIARRRRRRRRTDS